MKRILLAALASLLAAGMAGAQTPLAPESVPGEVVYVPFPVEITLDGDLGDWAGVPTVTVTKGPMTSDDPAENGSFTFAVAADETRLYVQMTMPDATIIAGQHGTDFWNEDSLEFFVNLTGDFGARGYRDGIAQINVNAADIGNSDPTDITLTGLRATTLPVEAVVFETADGWGFEAAVDVSGWLTITHGAEFGFQAQANGASVQDRDVKLIWSNADTNDASWQNPSVFGRALLFEIGQTEIPQPSVVVEETVEVDPAQWQEVVRASWEGYKANYIFCGEPCGNNLGLVFDPNMGYQAVSEGVGYGLLMAVMLDDQATFDTIYDAAHDVMLDEETGLFHWRADNTGTLTGTGSATDAEEDIAAALIFAQTRVERGEWTQHATRPYGERANGLIDAIYQYEVADGRYLTPGDEWGGEGREIINLSYFAPAWYRIYDAFQGTDRWMPVIRQGYTSLFRTRGEHRGLAPDWSTADGRPAYAYCDAEGRPREVCRYEMTYDAIRVPWRIGLDCLWFGDPRACEWSERTAAFLNETPDESFAMMYDMEGAPVISFQNELTTGMWVVAALAAGDADLTQRLSEDLYGYAGTALTDGYWGGTPQYYFNQSLAWFGAALLSGDFRNLYAEDAGP